MRGRPYFLTLLRNTATGETPRPGAVLRHLALGVALVAADARAVSPDEFRARTARELLGLCSGEGSAATP